ncbi:MAG: sialidase family protein, partial [Planctomycetota bacterium]
MSTTIAGLASGQIMFPPVNIGPARQLGIDGEDWRETAIGGSQTNESEFVAICYNGHFALSTDGGVHQTRGNTSWSSGDPFVACGPGSGTIWMGGFSPSDYLVRLTYKLPDDATLGLNPIFVPSIISDKPSLCIGPIPGDMGVHREHVLFNRRETGMGSCAVPTGVGSFSDAFIEPPIPIDPQAQPVFVRYRVKPDTSSHECDYEGWGITGVVLSDGIVVAAARDAKRSSGTFVYNQGRPYVVRSEDGGHHWLPDGGTPVNLEGFPPIQANKIWDGGPGDTPFGIDGRASAPSIARDPNTDWIYVAFAARSEPNAGTVEGNSDLYIFRSTNGGQSFPNGDYVHLTDAMLGIPTGQISVNGPDQVMPAITVDCQGGVNVVYYDTRNDLAGTPYTNDMVDVYYSRITNFGLASMAVTTTRFTSTSMFAGGFGDFMTLASAGPSARVLYSAYVITVPEGNGWANAKRCFLRKITM